MAWLQDSNHECGSLGAGGKNVEKNKMQKNERRERERQGNYN